MRNEEQGMGKIALTLLSVRGASSLDRAKAFSWSALLATVTAQVSGSIKTRPGAKPGGGGIINTLSVC